MWWPHEKPRCKGAPHTQASKGWMDVRETRYWRRDSRVNRLLCQAPRQHCFGLTQCTDHEIHHTGWGTGIRGEPGREPVPASQHSSKQ